MATTGAPKQRQRAASKARIAAFRGQRASLEKLGILPPRLSGTAQLGLAPDKKLRE